MKGSLKTILFTTIIILTTCAGRNANPVLIHTVWRSR